MYDPISYLVTKASLDGLLLRAIPTFLYAAPFYPMVRVGVWVSEVAQGRCACLRYDRPKARTVVRLTANGTIARLCPPSQCISLTRPSSPAQMGLQSGATNVSLYLFATATFALVVGAFAFAATVGA